ncbi:MAG: TolC family protein [Puia sp.]|nr:TolC family protein [Puia sp.]
MKRHLLLYVTVLLACLAGGGQTANAQNNSSLDYYLAQALQNSPLLRDYEGQVLANQVDSQRILAGYKPQVTGSSVNNYAPVLNSWGYDQAISNGGNFSTLVSVNKTLVGKKNLSTQFDAIRLSNDSLRNNARISEQDLKKNITAQYVTAYGDMLQLDFNRDMIGLLQKEEGILKELTARNVYRQTDYLAFLVTLQQEKLLFKQLQIQFQNDYGTLNYLAGINDTAAVSLADPQIVLDQLPELYNSVFYRKFTIDSLKLINDRSLIDFSYRPKASLYADAGYSSTLAYEAYKNFGTSFGVTVTVPIYDGHQKRLLTSKLDIARRTQDSYKRFFTSQYRQQLAQLSQQLKATEELIGEINDQIKYSQGLIDVNGKLLETGDARISDYIIALGSYLNAKNLLTQNKITRMQIINQINYWNR